MASWKWANSCKVVSSLEVQVLSLSQATKAVQKCDSSEESWSLWVLSPLRPMHLNVTRSKLIPFSHTSPRYFLKSNWSNIGPSRMPTSHNHKRPSTTCASPPTPPRDSSTTLALKLSFHTQKHCFGIKNNILTPPPPLATQKTREWSLFSYPHFIQEAASDKGASFIYTSLGSQGKEISFVYLCCINFSK